MLLQQNAMIPRKIMACLRYVPQHVESQTVCPSKRLAAGASCIYAVTYSTAPILLVRSNSHFTASLQTANITDNCFLTF